MSLFVHQLKTNLSTILGDYMYKKLKKLFIPFVCLMFAIVDMRNCYAQKVPRLKDINRINIVEKGSFTSGIYRQYEVIRSGSQWKSYQTASYEKGNLDTTSRKFVRNIKRKMLKELITTLNERDTSINIDFFDINKKELALYVDSLDDYPSVSKKIILSPNQKREFIDTLGSKSIIQQAFQKVMKPIYLDDRTYYGIKIITGLKDTSTVYAYSFADLYYLPWIINNRKIYNPNITLTYEYIKDNKTFPGREKQYLYKRIVQNIYWKYFQRKFNQ